MQDRVNRFIVANSRISEEKLRELMFRTGDLARDIGTVVVGHDAVRFGLIDEVGGLHQALRRLELMIEERRPRNGANGPAQAAPVLPAGQPGGGLLQ